MTLVAVARTQGGAETTQALLMACVLVAKENGVPLVWLEENLQLFWQKLNQTN